jgi:hypothetical protein
MTRMAPLPNVHRTTLHRALKTEVLPGAPALASPRSCEQIDRTYHRRIHGHTNEAQVLVRGAVDPTTRIAVDLGILRTKIDCVSERLHHRFFDEVPELGLATVPGSAPTSLGHPRALYGAQRATGKR